MKIVLGDVGSAFKGAATDAVEKALALFSIGNRAYLGLLNKATVDNRDFTENDFDLSGITTHEQAQEYYRKNRNKINKLSPEERQKIIAKLSRIK